MTNNSRHLTGFGKTNQKKRKQGERVPGSMGINAGKNLLTYWNH